MTLLSLLYGGSIQNIKLIPKYAQKYQNSAYLEVKILCCKWGVSKDASLQVGYTVLFSKQIPMCWKITTPSSLGKTI